MVLVLVVEVVWGWYISQFCFCLLLDHILLAFLVLLSPVHQYVLWMYQHRCCKETLHLCLNW